MFRHSTLAAALILTGCSKTDVAAEMEASLESTNHAIGIALIVADIASYHLDSPAEIPTGATSGDTGDTGVLDVRRHGEIGPCPGLFALSDDLIEIDFGTGCLPSSGLMPVVVAGATLVERRGDNFDGEFDTYAINLSHFITGSMTGTTTGVEGDLDISATFEIAATDGESELTASGSVTADFANDEVVLNGEVILEDGGRVKQTLKNVRLKLSDIPGECPEPASGKATAHRDTEAVVDYGRPGGGQVTVALGNRTSDDVRLCAFDSWIF